MCNINDNAVQGGLSKNYLMRKFIAQNILDTKYYFAIYGTLYTGGKVHVPRLLPAFQCTPTWYVACVCSIEKLGEIQD